MTATPHSQGKYGLRILTDPPSATIDFVFIHGLTGNRESTWTDEKSGTFWPLDLLPASLPTARIMTFGYDADIVNAIDVASSNTLRDHGKSLAHALTYERMDAEERPVIFVAHSLGGLVCEQALLICDRSLEQRTTAILEATRGIIFLGTPHVGTDLAKWGRILTGISKAFRKTNKDIIRVLSPGSEMLANVQQEFGMMLEGRREEGKRRITMFCFYEELGYIGIGEIVPKHSAILPNCENQSIHSNHKGMVRFSGIDDNGYKMVSGRLRMLAKEVEREPKTTEEIRQLRSQKLGQPQVIYSGTINSTGTGSVFQGNRNIGSIISEGRWNR